VVIGSGTVQWRRAQFQIMFGRPSIREEVIGNLTAGRALLKEFRSTPRMAEGKRFDERPPASSACQAGLVAVAPVTAILIMSDRNDPVAVRKQSTADVHEDEC
jgi:hypothetical protein